MGRGTMEPHLCPETALLTVRPAQSCDAPALTDLAARSEAHWGCDAAFMDAFRQLYRITEAFIAEHTVFVAEEVGRVLGFYALVDDGDGDDEGVELEYLYLDPAQLGRGLGRILWEHMVAHCRANGVERIHLVCGPEPKAFYLKMGAVQTGETESLVVPGRRVARLAYRIPAA